MKDSTCTAKNVYGTCNVITGGDIDRCSIVCQGFCQEGRNQGTI